MKKLLTALLMTAAVLTGCGQKTASDAQVSSISHLSKVNKSESRAVAKKAEKNASLEADISSLQKRLNRDHDKAKSASEDEAELKSSAAKENSEVLAKSVSEAKKAAAQTKAQATQNNENLANRNYAGQQEVVINSDNPGFSQADLSTASGAWERYTDLDNLNRAVDANALLNQSLMPTAKREGLTWDPTGWHNRRTAHGWLYNRSHLIGFQLSGENNNPKNLITGTMSLNNPLMLAHEMDIATYLKASSSHYVRYEVKPWYRGNELVARGVQMRAQSLGDNSIHFNVYIFNVESGYNIDYATGTSTTN